VTVALALGWHRAFPALVQVDRLEDIEPAEVLVYPPVFETCCQSGADVQRPPQSQPTEANARTSTPPALELGVLDRVDVDRLAVGVHRPALRAAATA